MLAAIACVSLAAGASADVITEFPSHNCGSQTSAGTVTGCGLIAEYVVPGPDVRLFDVVVGLGDASRIFTADASNPDFAAFVALMTNGRDDFLRTETVNYVEGSPGGGSASNRPESDWLEDFETLTGSDLVGYEITSIDLRIDSVSVIPPGGIPFPGLRARAGLVLNGVLIPEPSTAALLGLGIVLLTAARPRRGRRDWILLEPRGEEPRVRRRSHARRRPREPTASRSR